MRERERRSERETEREREREREREMALGRCSQIQCGQERDIWSVVEEERGRLSRRERGNLCRRERDAVFISYKSRSTQRGR